MSLNPFKPVKDWVTTGNSGGIVSVRRGGECRSMIIAVDGYKYVGKEANGTIVPVDSRPDDHDVSQAPMPIFGNIWGWYWVSMFKPIVVHTFPLEFEELRSGAQGPATSDDEENVVYRGADFRLVHIKTEISVLYWRHTYPFPIMEAETKDGFPVNLVVNVTLQVVNPYPVMYIWEGADIRGINNAVRSAVITFVRDYDYKSEGQSYYVTNKEGKRRKKKRPPLIGIDKRMYVPNAEEGAQDSDDYDLTDFAKSIESLNHGTIRDPEGNITEGGITALYGRKIVRVELVEIQLGEKHQDIEKATYAKEVASLEADAQKEVGRGEGERILEREKRRAEGLQLVMQSIADQRGGAEVAVSENLRDAIQGTKVRTLFLGNQQGPVPSIPVTPAPTDN